MNSYNELEERTINFSIEIIKLINKLPYSLSNQIIAKQLIRSSTSVGANYSEANEAVTPADRKYKISICRKEIKESLYWLKILIRSNNKFEEEIKENINENTALIKIFATIYMKLY